MFPCFDEPGYKTPFELSVVRPRDMVALSNVPVARTEDINDEPNAVWDHFERTPPMSTFTLGLVIADLKQFGSAIHYEDENGNNIEIRVWGRPEFVEMLEGLNEKVAQVFSEVANFWQVPLPLRRLDIVALPNYQGVKPADNWGLIVFKESDLSSRGYLQLSQELSYQWLGALVSPAWWSDAHLNKALVGYLAAEIAFKINNGSEMEGKWPMTVLYSLYYEFSKRYPHSRITGMKQETACTKIELLFRMFNYTIGGDTFRKGMRKFIESRKFKTFTGDDIWNALNEAALADGKIPKDINIKTVATSWIEKDRLPVITVKRNYETNTAFVTQKVYLRERPHDLPSSNKMLWSAPLVVCRSDRLSFEDFTPSSWIRHTDLNLLNMPDDKHFIIVNPEEIGKRKSVKGDEIIHRDAFSSPIKKSIIIKTNTVITEISHMENYISDRSYKFCLRAYVRTLLTPLYNEMVRDVKDDGDNRRKSLYSLTKTFLCQVGFKPCIMEAQEQFSNWMQAPNPDEGNPISNQYICPVFKWGTQKEWDFGLQRVINFPPSRKQSERTYLLKTLAGCPVDEKKIEKLLNITILEGNGNFTETDLFLIFSMLTGNSQGYTTLFYFLNNNWDVLKEKFSSKTNIWDNMITSATSQFTTKPGMNLVAIMYDNHKGEFGSAEHIIEKSLRNIREEAKWSEENIPVIETWLDDYLSRTEVKDDQAIDA
ncbi:protease m1 zinc metalloprotease [Danaus plexippus plexippus]|uniref:Protease m1 zinc metalloprotease n=1 Tax=Danaus plexippus plexippus TaxID=278856 RepID=A0A212F119_DANPL|nr:protease m1 zinc metalloprotease [Danaus plexippus plexippus]